MDGAGCESGGYLCPCSVRVCTKKNIGWIEIDWEFPQAADRAGFTVDQLVQEAVGYVGRRTASSCRRASGTVAECWEYDREFSVSAWLLRARGST